MTLNADAFHSDAMDVEPVVLYDVDPAKLSDTDQRQIVQFVLDSWEKGKAARQPYEEIWENSEKAYHCQQEPFKNKKFEWRTQLFLPWAYDAVESWYAYVHAMLIPRDEDFFDIQARTYDDQDSNQIMSDYLKFALDRAGLAERFGLFLKQYSIMGPSVLKVYWREETRTYTDWEMTLLPENTDEAGKMPEKFTPEYRQVIKEAPLYKGVWFDVIDMADFVFYPVQGDFEKTTRIHQTYRFYDELMSEASSHHSCYFNLEQLSARDEQDASAWLLNDSKQGSGQQGINLKEAWIYRIKVGDTVYRNVVATIANDKTLIRFEANPYEMGRSPFIYDVMVQDGQSLLGWGLLGKALDLLKTANFLASAKLDVLKLGIYGAYKYVDDGVFNPYSFIAQPGALVKVGELSNLVPVGEQLDQVNVAFSEIQALKAEFEEITMPKIVKGQLEQGPMTATEVFHAQNNASGKMHVAAQRLNEKVLKPMIELVYLIIRQHAMVDPTIKEEIARLSLPSREILPPMNPSGVQAEVPGMQGSPMQNLPPAWVEIPLTELANRLPHFLPLPEIDINIVGYQNNLRRQDTLRNMQTLLRNFSESPVAPFINWKEAAKTAIRLMDLEQSGLLLPDSEAGLMAEPKSDPKLQLEMAKFQHEQQIDIEKLKLEQFKLQNEMDAHLDEKQLALVQQIEKNLNPPKSKEIEDNAFKETPSSLGSKSEEV